MPFFDFAKMGLDAVKKMDLNHNHKPDIEELQVEVAKISADLAPLVAKLDHTHALAILTGLNSLAGNPFNTSEITLLINVGGRVITGLKKLATVLQSVK